MTARYRGIQWPHKPYRCGVILPVWVATWEYECCQPDASVGAAWKGSVFLHGAEPWWATEPSSLPPEVLQLGVVDLEVRVLRPAPGVGGAALVAADDIRLGAVGLDLSDGPQRIVGRVVFEGHVGPGGVDLDEVECHGTVRRVRRVPLLRENRDGMWVPIRQLPPVDVDSTADRQRDGLPPQQPGATYVTDDLLVDVEIEPAA